MIQTQATEVIVDSSNAQHESSQVFHLYPSAIIEYIYVYIMYIIYNRHILVSHNVMVIIDLITPGTDPASFRLDFVEVYAPSPEICENLAKDLQIIRCNQTWQWEIP